MFTDSALTDYTLAILLLAGLAFSTLLVLAAAVLSSKAFAELATLVHFLAELVRDVLPMHAHPDSSTGKDKDAGADTPDDADPI